jgi:hypothetical protein
MVQEMHASPQVNESTAVGVAVPMSLCRVPPEQKPQRVASFRKRRRYSKASVIVRYLSSGVKGYWISLGDGERVWGWDYVEDSEEQGTFERRAARWLAPRFCGGLTERGANQVYL